MLPRAHLRAPQPDRPAHPSGSSTIEHFHYAMMQPGVVLSGEMQDLDMLQYAYKVSITLHPAHL